MHSGAYHFKGQTLKEKHASHHSLSCAASDRHHFHRHVLENGIRYEHVAHNFRGGKQNVAKVITQKQGKENPAQFGTLG